MRIESNQRGYVIVTVAGCIVMLLAFGALAVDLGMLYSARASSQRAADAAALAGAFTFLVDPTSPQPATATNFALNAATNNKVLGVPITAAQVTTSVDLVNHRVTVTITRSENTYLAKIMSFNTVTDTVQAVAEASPTATAAVCVKPWFIPNTVFSSSAPCTACTATPPEVLLTGDPPTATAYATSKYGTQISIKPQDPGGAIGSGQFYAIQFPADTGGSDYRDSIGTCKPNTVTCQRNYSVKTGNMVGPTKQGVEDLVGKPPRDTYVNIGQYRWPDGNIHDTSHALVIAPIWDTCSFPGFCPGNQFPSGTGVTVTVKGFALIFLEGVSGNDVVARLIRVLPCDSLPPTTDETGPYAIPIRLVRLP
jgi:Flp pilus assembly protein TadG